MLMDFIMSESMLMVYGDIFLLMITYLKLMEKQLERDLTMITRLNYGFL